MGIFESAVAIFTNIPADVKALVTSPGTAITVGAAELLSDPVGTVTGVSFPVGIGLGDIVGIATGGGSSATGGGVSTFQGSQPSAAGAVNITGFGGGNGKTATRTIVQTLDLTTMKITAQKVIEGSPKLMNKDVAAMRKVLKVSADLRKRTPKQKTKPSQMTEMKNAIMQRAIFGLGCPTKSDS